MTLASASILKGLLTKFYNLYRYIDKVYIDGPLIYIDIVYIDKPLIKIKKT